MHDFYIDCEMAPFYYFDKWPLPNMAKIVLQRVLKRKCQSTFFCSLLTFAKEHVCAASEPSPVLDVQISILSLLYLKFGSATHY